MTKFTVLLLSQYKLYNILLAQETEELKPISEAEELRRISEAEELRPISEAEELRPISEAGGLFQNKDDSPSVTSY
ncbi:hypothetical protein CHS0354_002863 [Potamilus streckersoni]|uniref:Uncharacterized protein n=1 Tax=Potamilus streckersoni TaxID=2493646 RepID=A0AAE0SMT8_9BIVA|nr:hypothetical protein CHS0354_002863 [Potamilus streckersoni]